MRAINVRENVQRYLCGGGKDMGLHPDGRYASFDYCFNYFQVFREQGRIADICSPQNIQQSCLQLGFYLASWGMLRGSSFLLSKSVRFYKRVLDVIVTGPQSLWSIDVDAYSSENIDLLMEAKQALCRALDRTDKDTDTLVSKIMLGVYGNVPAFDTYFRAGLGVSTFGRKNLKKVADFYECHRDSIDDWSQRLFTFDFNTGTPTQRRYTKAKIVDMAVVMEGQ